MKKKILKPLISIAVLVVFTVLIGRYLFENWHEFTNISITEPFYLIPAAFLIVINIYATGIVLDLAIEPHGVKLSKQEAFGLANITRFSNQFSPSYVGATLRARYIKRSYGVSYTKFSSSFLVSNLLQFMISGLLAITAFLVVTPVFDNGQPLIFISIAIIIFLTALYIPIPYFIRIAKKIENRRTRFEKLFKWGGELLEGYATVRNHPGILQHTVLWMFVTTLSLAGVFFLLYGSLGSQVSLLGALFIAALSSWSIIFAITPGNIGVREGLIVVAAGIVGANIAITLVVAILLRLLMLIVSGFFSIFFASKIISPPNIRQG